MARIRALGPDGAPLAELDSGSAVSLLNSLLASGVRIRHDCGGKALCGSCAVRVAAGAPGLSPIKALEAARLAATGLAPAGAEAGFRLACQAHASRDLEISLPAESPGKGDRR